MANMIILLIMEDVKDSVIVWNGFTILKMIIWKILAEIR